MLKVRQVFERDGDDGNNNLRGEEVRIVVEFIYLVVMFNMDVRGKLYLKAVMQGRKLEIKKSSYVWRK